MLCGELFYVGFINFAAVDRLKSVLIQGMVVGVAMLEVLVIKPPAVGYDLDLARIRAHHRLCDTRSLLGVTGAAGLIYHAKTARSRSEKIEQISLRRAAMGFGRVF